jgi:hypothetical protein
MVAAGGGGCLCGRRRGLPWRAVHAVFDLALVQECPRLQRRQLWPATSQELATARPPRAVLRCCPRPSLRSARRARLCCRRFSQTAFTRTPRCSPARCAARAPGAARGSPPSCAPPPPPLPLRRRVRHPRSLTRHSTTPLRLCSQRSITEAAGLPCVRCRCSPLSSRALGRRLTTGEARWLTSSQHTVRCNLMRVAGSSGCICGSPMAWPIRSRRPSACATGCQSPPRCSSRRKQMLRGLRRSRSGFHSAQPAVVAAALACWLALLGRILPPSPRCCRQRSTASRSGPRIQRRSAERRHRFLLCNTSTCICSRSRSRSRQRSTGEPRDRPVVVVVVVVVVVEQARGCRHHLRRSLSKWTCRP